MRSWFYFDSRYLLNELKPMFKKQYLREDIFAGLTVACVAIPLSLAIAMASHLSPGVGLTSAIIGGLIAAFFGGTRLAVTGPAAAMAVLIANCVETYGVAGLLIIGLICGILQIIFGLLRLGRFAKLVPLPVISAFTAGIGFIIFVSQLPKALQLPAPDQNHVLYVIKHIGHYITSMEPMAFILAIITLIILKVLPKYFPKLPTPLIAVAIPTAIVYFCGMQDIKLVGTIPHSLSIPQMPDFTGIDDWKALISSALEVFALASLETLLSSSAVDNMGKGDLHNPNQELIGQGLANVGVTLFGGLPVTGVIARSTVNIVAGAKTRRSPIIHSVAILLVIYLCPKLIEIIPVAALAGILLSAAISMMNMKELIEFWRTDKSEVAIYVSTFIMIVITDLIDGVKAGIIVAFIIVAIRMLTTKSVVKLWTNRTVLRIDLSGSMTFWSFEKLSKFQAYVSSQTELRVVIFEFDNVHGMDSSGALHLVNVSKEINNYGITVIFNHLSEDQKKLLSISDPSNNSYTETQDEIEIKAILENLGIPHTANDMLKQGMGKFLGHYAQDKKILLDILKDKRKPHTLLVTCADSRLNPERFFLAGLGELFIIKNMGNFIPKYNPDNISSETAAIEYAIADLGIRNIVICAHTECNTIKAALRYDTVATDSSWIKHIHNDLNCDKPLELTEATKVNLINQISNLKTYPMVQALEMTKELTISAWIYNIREASILEWDGQEFKSILINT